MTTRGGLTVRCHIPDDPKVGPTKADPYRLPDRRVLAQCPVCLCSLTVELFGTEPRFAPADRVMPTWALAQTRWLAAEGQGATRAVCNRLRAEFQRVRDSRVVAYAHAPCGPLAVLSGFDHFAPRGHG